MAQRKGGRPATGSIKWRLNRATGAWQWFARVTIGSRRPFVALDPSIPLGDEERARAGAREVSSLARSAGAVPAAESETVAKWFGRWCEARITKGLRSPRMDRSRFENWVAERLGQKTMIGVSRRDIEELVQALDAAVVRRELSAKTASNVWGVVTKMFKDACRSKVLSLRVRDTNPAQDVEGPDRGAERDGPYVYPKEFVAMLQSPRVPARWKRVFALGAYLYVRGGELEALEWSSVNFDQRYVHVHQAIDSDTGAVKTTKTKRNRKVSIEPSLLPLLIEMHRAAGGKGRVVVRMPLREDWAERLRKYLRWGLEDAGLPIREDLFANDETRRPLSFHDLRHTGITWRAVRGDEPLKIQRAAGHDDLRTTQRYIEESEAFDRDGFGEVFPALELPHLLPHLGTDEFRIAVPVSDPESSDRPETRLIVVAPEGFEDSQQSTGLIENSPATARSAPDGKTEFARGEDAPSGVGPIEPHSGSLKPERADPDDALRAAIKAALDVGDLARASALLDVLKATSHRASVVPIDSRRRERK